MFSFLPEKEKKKVIKIYKYRKAILFFIFLTFSFVSFSVFVSPSFIFSHTKERESENNLIRPFLITEQDELDELSDNINILNEKISILQDLGSENHIPSLVFDSVFVSVDQTISLLGLIYTNKNEEISIFINGIAEDRSSLLNFQNRLKEIDKFLDVNLPISSFAGDSDIDFSIKVILKEKNG